MRPVRAAHPLMFHRRLGAFTAALSLALLTVLGAASYAHAVGPGSVTIPGSHGTEIGCEQDWQPECAAGELTEDPESGLLTGTFDIPAGEYAYKVAIGGAWDENYGAGGAAGGSDITYTHGGGEITFWYDPTTHIARTTADGPIITLPGSFNAALGCESDWAPSCMATWMTDADDDGVYTWSTSALAACSYEVKVAHDRSWDESYGEGGAAGGANMSFSTSSGKTITFRYTLESHVLEIIAEDPLVTGAGKQLAHIIDQDTIAWPADLAPDPGGSRFALFSAGQPTSSPREPTDGGVPSDGVPSDGTAPSGQPGDGSTSAPAAQSGSSADGSDGSSLARTGFAAGGVALAAAVTIVLSLGARRWAVHRR